MSDEGGIYKLMANYDKRWVYLVLFVIVLYSLIRPIGMPIGISAMTKNYKTELDTLQEGDIVFSTWNMEFSGYMELKPGVLATHKMFIEKGVKLCIAFGHFECVALPPEIFKQIRTTLDEYDYTEGEDYVIIGYVFPNEAAVAALARDFHANVRVDWKGNSIEGTFLDEIQNAGDFDMISDYTTGLATSWLINHVVLEYNVPMVENSIGVSVPGHLANLDAGLLTGLLASTRGGAELEFLINAPGPGLKSMDAFTFGHYSLIIFIIIGNIGYYGWTRRTGARERTGVR
ncbi:hypothetical protein ES703_10422 [subsurface metagenome]